MPVGQIGQTKGTGELVGSDLPSGWRCGLGGLKLNIETLEMIGTLIRGEHELPCTPIVSFLPTSISQLPTFQSVSSCSQLGNGPHCPGEQGQAVAVRISREGSIPLDSGYVTCWRRLARLKKPRALGFALAHCSRLDPVARPSCGVCSAGIAQGAADEQRP